MKGPELFQYGEDHGFGQLHCNIDPHTHLHQVIAIHSTHRGPALGGCRFLPYDSSIAAIHDAMRLARSMSYKAAMVDLPFGGGKCVLIRPPEMTDRQTYFKAVGRFINQLNGQYITAIDSGTTHHDMDVISTETPYVTCLSGANDETSLYTSKGVYNGIMAAVKHKLQRDDVKGLHVAIQGVGQVGFHLAQILYEQGAKLSVSDLKESILQTCQEKFSATIVDPKEIHTIDCDVFAPCALGAILNTESIDQITAPIIAGSANNQLAHTADGKLLLAKEILYCPDYIINAGGLIYAAGRYLDHSQDQINQKLASIHDNLLNVFQRAERENVSYNEIADAMAAEKL